MLTLKSPYAELSAAGYDTLDVELERSAWRQIWVSPVFMTWWTDELPNLAPDGDIRDPLSQLVAFSARFIEGEPVLIKASDDSGEGVRLMRPDESGVWEICSSDTRVFGWFCGQDIFVAVNAGYTKTIKDLRLYSGYRDEVVTHRNRLKIPDPSYVDGKVYGDVLSNRP